MFYVGVASLQLQHPKLCEEAVSPASHLNGTASGISCVSIMLDSVQ